mgnify:CR=1 FL=1
MTAPLRLLGAADPGVNAAPFDAWTPTHVLTGLVAGAIGVPLPWAIGGAVLYEVAEYAVEKRPESIANVAVDLAVFLGAWWLGARVR